MALLSTPLKEPNILLAASNCQRMIKNIEHLLDVASIDKLKGEVHRHVVRLYYLGDEHLQFAVSIDSQFWRQKISRFYYGAYNIRRAIALNHSGHFATDITDHKKIGDFPDDFPNRNTFATELEGLREDRNLADYNHDAKESDLLKTPDDVATLVMEFRAEANKYLTTRGIVL